MALGLLGFGALRSSAYVHPDERSHVEAIRYFENHVHLPGPGTVDLYYSEYGRSRVYSGEWPHWFLGRVGAFLAACGWEGLGRTRIYRAIGIAAFLLFLWICTGWQEERGYGLLLSWMFVLIPQVLYLFTYCNSDGLSLIAACLLLLHTISMVEQRQIRIRDWTAFGVLVAVVGVGRLQHWCVFVPVMGILVLHFFEGMQLSRQVPLRGLAMTLLLAAIPAVAWRVEYPKSMGISEDALTALAEVHATPRFKPSRPIALTMKLKDRGFDVAGLTPDWMKATMQSSYARFGRYRNELPGLARLGYGTAGVSLVLLLLVSTGVLIAKRRLLPLWLKSLSLSTPCGLLMILAASLDHSINGDWQPQGRYLFGMLPPAALLLLCPLAALGGTARRGLTVFLAMMSLLGGAVYLRLLAEVVV